MDRYQRVEKPRPETTINENEIRITTQGRMRNYITYATTLLQVCLFSVDMLVLFVHVDELDWFWDTSVMVILISQQIVCLLFLSLYRLFFCLCIIGVFREIIIATTVMYFTQLTVCYFYAFVCEVCFWNCDKRRIWL